MNFSDMNRNDLAVLAGGALTLILSLFPAYVTVTMDASSSSLPGVSAGTNAWTSFATFGMLLVLLATAVVAIRTFAGHLLRTGVPWSLLTAVFTVVGALLLILRPLTTSAGMMGISVGPGWSAWLIFIASAAMSVFAIRAFLASGEKIPGSESDAGESSTS